MILAAGRGTRLQPLTDETPKPLLTVAGKPLIHWQIEALAQAGVTDLIINLHHLGEQIETSVGDGSTFGVKIVYSHETELLETGGGIIRALPFFENEPFWLLNGDIWTDFDFARLPTSPGEILEGSSAHLVLTPTPGYREHGDFEWSDGRITSRGEAYVFCGIAVLSPELFVNERRKHFSVVELYWDLIPTGLLTAQIHEGVWGDIGTLEQYEAITKSDTLRTP